MHRNYSEVEPKLIAYNTLENTSHRITSRAVDSDSKKSNKSRMPKSLSFLSDLLTGRKPLLSWSFLDVSDLCRTSGSYKCLKKIF